MIAVGATLMVVLGACGSDDGGESDGDRTEAQGPPSTEEPTTTTQPSATEDEEAAFAAVREVFDERGELRDELFQDPTLLDDPDSDHVERLRDLHTDALQHSVDATIDFARGLLDDGHRQQAAGRIMTDWGLYRMEAVEADRITFEACIIEDSVKVDEAGEPVPDSNTVFGTFGVGEARRIDGLWRLHDLTRDTDLDLTEEVRTPGELFAGACDREFGEGEVETP